MSRPGLRRPPGQDPRTHAAVLTHAQSTEVVKRWREGRGRDTQHVLLLRGPWGLRLLETWGRRWVAWRVDPGDLEEVESIIQELLDRRCLFNLGACMDPAMEVCDE